MSSRRVTAVACWVGGFALLLQPGCVHDATNDPATPATGLSPSDPSTGSTSIPPAPSASAGPSSLDAVAAAHARQMFSKAISCPDDRITVTPAAANQVSPPPEVAADPGRLAVWQQNRAADPRKHFDVTGCDRHIRVACNEFAGEGSVAPDAFCLPEFDPGASAGRVIIDPATQQQALAQLQRVEGSAPHGPQLGVGLAPVPGLGLVVGAVLPGGPADGKLRAADVILAAGGQPVTDAATLHAVVLAHAGQTLDLRVRRNGQDTTITLNVPSP